MHFRLIATERRTSSNGTKYDHTVWMGEFDGLEVDEDDAIEFARAKVGAHCRIQAEPFPVTIH